MEEPNKLFEQDKNEYKSVFALGRGRPRTKSKMPDVVKRPRGRPVKFVYTDEHAEKLFEIMSRSGDLSEILLAFGISDKTFYAHLNKNEKLKSDYEEGKLLSIKHLDNMFMEVLTQPNNPKYKNFNTKLAVWLAANKHRDKYSHAMGSASGGNTINIENMNAINSTNITLEHENILKEIEMFSSDPEVIKQLKDVKPIETKEIETE